MSSARANYSVFGTSAALKTLTGSFVADSVRNSGVILFDGFRELTLNLSFTTGSGTGEFCSVQIETCNDYSSPTNWFVFGEVNAPDASPPTTLTISGTPYRFPGDVTTPAATTNYPRSYSVKLQAKWVRFKVKSSAGSGFGSAWLEVWCSER